MGFWAWIQKIRKRNEKPVLSVRREPAALPPSAQGISAETLKTISRAGALLAENRYLPRSAWLCFEASLEKAAQEMSARKYPVSDLEKAGVRQAQHVADMLQNFPDAVDEHNRRFVEKALCSQKEILDHLLDRVDPSISLDRNQREVVLSDEDHTLVVAGAGAGKTTTVAARIAYLCGVCGVPPERILVVTFTRMAVEELRERINRQLGLACPITTFHATGNAILRRKDPLPRKVVDDGFLYYTIRSYFLDRIMASPETARKVMLFFGMYLDGPVLQTDPDTYRKQAAQMTLSTLRSELNGYEREILDRQFRKKVTLQSEVLRSGQEVEIANTLYLNGLDYQYEPMYPFAIPGARKPYTPDFVITQGDRKVYLEHFGISEDGKSSRMSEQELCTYKEHANQKVLLHRSHGTELIYTYASYRDGRPLWEHLLEELRRHGIELKPRDPAEVVHSIVQQENSRYARKMLNLICTFIRNFKTNGYGENDFERMHRESDNVRTKLFLEIARSCYLEYERALGERQSVDFQDMINESVRVLEDVASLKTPLNFDYIIVDEYQDISRQRFDLVKSLSGVTGAKVMAVGDDWQSIYAFSGSDISLFTHFREAMGWAKIMRIENTYRNAQEVIDVAGGFVQRNPEQLRKTLHSPMHIRDPILVLTYDPARRDKTTDWRSGQVFATAKCVQEALGKIREYAREDGKPCGHTLLLGRYAFDGRQLENSGLFEYKHEKLTCIEYPDMEITFMTAHASKGLGYDNVIIINGKNAVYGFPSKIEADPVLNLVVHVDRSMDYAEERRLFYVAMTRTRNRVYMVAPQGAPSEFILEIEKQFPEQVKMLGTWREDSVMPAGRRRCPVCGCPLQIRYNEAYGLRLYMCTNEPEICDFMTNDLRGGPYSIRKCDMCRDGYLLVRMAKGRPFLGCTEWRSDGKGCSRTVTLEPLDIKPAPQRGEGDGPAPEKAAGQKKRRVPKVLPPADERQAKIIPECVLRPVTEGGMDINFLAHSVLQAAADISWTRYYSENVLLDVLQGQSSPVIRRDLLDQMPCFGRFRNMPRSTLEKVTAWLIGHHFLLVTGGPAFALHLTWDALHYDQKMTSGLLRSLGKAVSQHGEG